MVSDLWCVELCAGAGGQALGLERAGFRHAALVEIDPDARMTLLRNRPKWPVIDGDAADLRCFDGSAYCGIDLIAAGIPCPPYSVAGLSRGERDERDLFPDLMRVVGEARPRAVLVENVPGLLRPRFAHIRERIDMQFAALGYVTSWTLVDATRYGLPQERRRVVIVAFRRDGGVVKEFSLPAGAPCTLTVGDLLISEMASLGWEGAVAWARQANGYAPALVGGSRRHGGPDLGPTGARKRWARLGIDGRGIADHPPLPGFAGTPRLTLRMCALLQGFPQEWEFCGSKTSIYRQIGNAFPPPVAQAAGQAIARVLA
jgi:DNA (cytosine-5)-methyltransferase 1